MRAPKRLTAFIRLYSLVRTMAVSQRSRDRVEARLSSLEATYRSFPVNQTTLSVPGDAYELERGRCADGLVDAYVRVENDADEVLLVRNGDAWTLPRTEPSRDERLEAGTCRALQRSTGVACEVTDLTRATIVGVRDDDDPDRDPMYRLVTLFAATHAGGAPDAGVQWRPEVPEAALPEY